MATTEKATHNRMYIVAVLLLLVGLSIVGKTLYIQIAQGDKYRQLAEQQIFKNDTIAANRGNLYDANGQLLATSISKYDIRFDAVTPYDKDFNEFVGPLATSLSRKLNKPKSYYLEKLKRARANKNRYLLIAEDLNYGDYMEIKAYPLFKKGPYRGGLIIEEHGVREHPLGAMAERIVGYDRPGSPPVGLEGAFGPYLRGVDGVRLKQKISKNQWKPINSANEVEPRDGYDVYTTIDVNMQDVAHHALLEQLEYFEADHGTAVVMEVATGEIKALTNLGRGKDGSYFEKRNYAVWESHEPGSTFKLMSVVAALEDKKVDTSTVFDTTGGVVTYYNRNVRDSKPGGYGKISVARAFELSSNVALVKMVRENYKDDPERYVDRLYNMNLNEKINLPISGEGSPRIPHPDDGSSWSGTTLPWMAYGYSVSLTALQTLTFYNAIANNGLMVRPRLIREIRSKDKLIQRFDRDIINPSVCSQETVNKVKVMMENVVRRGTAQNLYSENFSMAGKTGTCQKEYWKSSGNYISSFAGYFPADNPKYSCIVVIHKPNVAKGYYGNIVAGPVFKTIAQKIYATSPLIDKVNMPKTVPTRIQSSLDNYYTKVQSENKSMPDLRGMEAMDAVALLENMGARVATKGRGRVSLQSLAPGTTIRKNTNITLTLL